MTQENIIRAWRDAEYRASLTEAERAQLPAHPAGPVELSDADLDAVTGGLKHFRCLSTNTTFCHRNHLDWRSDCL
jgi:mersacidin/lichenicidin family type 2 lantibiotic